MNNWKVALILTKYLLLCLFELYLCSTALFKDSPNKSAAYQEVNKLTFRNHNSIGSKPLKVAI